MNKILITGGAGFIGSNLVEYFLNHDYEVVVLDNFSTGFMHNIVDFQNNKNFTLITGDIRNIQTCHLAVKNVDYVLHQAALGSVPRSIENPMDTTEVNITGFVNMLFASCEANVKRFIYAASSATYGDSQLFPKVEDCIGKPLSPYGITKYVNELYAENFSKIYGIETIGLRYFNVFGRKQAPNGAYAAVIPKFITTLLKHQSPTIYGDGSYSRDFTYIDNVIHANELAIQTHNRKAINTVFNVACGEQTSLNQLFEYLKANLSQYDSNIANLDAQYSAFRTGDIPHSFASIKKAKELLGYDLKYTVKDGLKETTKWYFNHFRNNEVEFT